MEDVTAKKKKKMVRMMCCDKNQTHSPLLDLKMENKVLEPRNVGGLFLEGKKKKKKRIKPHLKPPEGNMALPTP